MVIMRSNNGSGKTFRAMMGLYVSLLLALCAQLVAAKTVRYRSGFLYGDAMDELVLTVPAARQHCMRAPTCVSFCFQSPATRFPVDTVTAFFYPFADWHITGGEQPAFFEDSDWHTYVNKTREREQATREITMAMGQLGGNGGTMNKLRGKNQLLTTENKLIILDSLFHVAFPDEHKLLAAPLIIPTALELATSKTEDEHVRQSALVLLTVIADTEETGQLLFDAGVFESMRNIVQNRKNGEWDDCTKLALDVVSNMCLYRSANADLKKAGVQKFLHELLPEKGFSALQASMALTHLDDEELILPDEVLDEFVDVLRNAIDGDIAYGVKWDLLPGPLSAIKFLVFHTGKRLNHDQLLDAGVMEELLRILEDECLVAEEVEASLEILHSLAHHSERARHMILLAEETLQDAEERLQEYRNPSNLAKSLVAFIAGLESGRAEL